MSIPNSVHAVWVGGNPYPEKEKQLITINQKLLNESGFTYKVWTEEDIYQALPADSIARQFFDFCLERKKYAFASDIVKTYLLYTLGGWVVDADNEFLKSPITFAGLNWVSGFENYKGHTSPITAVMGAIPQHRFSKLLLDTYGANNFEDIISLPNTQWISSYLINHGGNKSNQRFYSQDYDVDIFPCDYFCGPEITDNTIALHHFSGSWLPKA